jgi:ABC-type transport system substrate-binding protein/class 3 adenylate cyclase
MSVTAGERRVVSALVADVAGSTAIGEQLGPERSKFLFDEIVRLMREEVERFGGTVAQLTGDGVLALFGVPTAHEDDSERAVRAALALHGSLARYAAEVAPAYGIELAARVAVNTGPVVVPERDAPPDVLYNALGDTVNVAARLQAFGDVVVGPTTARHVRDSFELQELGDVELKGKSEPVGAFRVVGVRERPPARLEAPLVGREQELAELSEALEELLEGRGAIISITGEPGIGKSRLVADVEKRFDGRVRFLAGHAVSYAEAIPYWPVRELLRSWLGLGVSDPEARVRLELRAELAHTLAENADEAYPFLATLLGLVLEPEQQQRMREFAGDAVQRQTFDWLYQLVCALARERPLCLVLEDLHWSDEATLSLLDELLPAAEQAPVGFLLVHRSDPDHSAWQLVDRAHRRFRRLFRDVELGPLPPADAQALAEADAGGELPEELAELLAERAGGNPYFVGEAIRDLRERGALDRHNGRLVLVGEASIPAALQEALQARLDRLDAEARELITTAAVIGRSFGLPLLERLLPRARLLPTLSELQWLQLVVEERRGPAPEYRFRHGLVQEVAYGTLLESRRRELHRAVGEALEGIHRDSPEEVLGLLARHFAEADEPERAIDYLLKAADAARSVDAEEEAIELYRRALRFMDRIGDEVRARRTLLKIALTHHLAFDFRAANEAFGEAFARPAPPPTRLQPMERITWAMPAAWDRTATPGHSWTEPAFEVARNLFCGLVAIGRDFAIEPELAERFTVSDDGRLYRFTLRPDTRWSDGVRVTAHDFAFTFAQMVEDDVATASWLDGVSAEAMDERTLEVRLDEPRNDFLYPLAQPPFFPWPRHVYEREGRDWHRAVPLVGNGPFVLTAREDDRLVIAASSTWHGDRGNVGAVTIEIEASPAAAAERWRRGDHDVLHDVLTFHAVADDQTEVQRSPGGWTWYVGFHSGRAPFDDARVRRALAHALDRQRPAELLRASAAPTGGLVPPTVPGHSHRAAPPFDPDRARALLREAGYADGRALGEIVLACLDLWEDAASDVAAGLAGIGVRVHLLVLGSDPELDPAIKERAHAFLWAWGEEYPGDAGRGFLEMILRGIPVLYRDEELEGLLRRAHSLRDRDERLRAYREFERIWIGERAAVVPIAYGDALLWRRPWVTGMWVNAGEISTFAHAVVRRPDSAPRRG